MTGPGTSFFASVLLRCGDRVLMMQRGMHKKLSPGKWANPGGHIEPDELRAPMRAAARELYEETGIKAEALRSFGLRYVLMTVSDQIRVHFTYVATVDSEPELWQTDEGTLHWMEKDKLLSLDLSETMLVTMEDYLAHPDCSTVRLGLRRGLEADWIATDARPDATFRPAAGTIARHGDRRLLLHRSEHKEIAPGLWANIGGHMEPEELNDPSATALREFGEEAGIPPEGLRNFTFSGALLVAKPHEFGLLFNYSAELEEEKPIAANEEDGAFHWIDKREIDGLPMTAPMKALALADARGDRPQVGLAYGEEIRLYGIG